MCCIARQPNIGQDIFSEPLIKFFCKDINPQDFTVKFAATNSYSIVKEMYPNYRVAIIINDTDVNFIIPQDCVYHVTLIGSDFPIALLPITPQIAVCYEKAQEKTAEEHSLWKRTIFDRDLIDRLNKISIYHEFSSSKDTF